MSYEGLTHSQRAMLAAQRPMVARGGEYRAARRLPSAREVAREMGISRTILTSAVHVARFGGPTMIEAIHAGRLSIDMAQQILKAVPRAQQAAAVEAALGKKRGEALAVALGEAPKPVRLRTRPLAERMARGLDQLESAADMLQMFLDEGGSEEAPARGEWLRRIHAVRRTLTKMSGGPT